MVNVYARRQLLLGLAALAAGCTTILGIDKDYHGGLDGGTAAQGAGGSSSVGASASTSGGGGSGTGAGGTGGTGGAGSCTGKGPAMVDLGAFCIDSTEVTNADYTAFLAANVTPQSVSHDPAPCSFNTSYVPTTGTPPNDSRPITSVNWCDAYAYCAWAGKHLCGKVDGGAAFYNAYTNASSDAWFAACTGGGSNTFPYGSSYMTTVCNGRDYGALTTIAVKEASGCKGTAPPYDGVYDLSGNVGEWEDSCIATTGATDTCRVRGGSYATANSMGLMCSANGTGPRNQETADVGFRCCSP